LKCRRLAELARRGERSSRWFPSFHILPSLTRKSLRFSARVIANSVALQIFLKMSTEEIQVAPAVEEQTTAAPETASPTKRAAEEPAEATEAKK
jgi:hypothetical protein